VTIKKYNPTVAKTGSENRLKSGVRALDTRTRDSWAFGARAKRNLVFAGLVTILLLFADQATKWAAHAWFSLPVEILPFASLRYAENTGIAWSIRIPFPVLLIMNFTLVGLFYWWSAKNFDFEKMLTVAVMALVSAGAFGNIIDRIRLGYVVDFVSVGFWPVFNLADAFLSVGIFLILLFYAKISRKV
jgi:signal peptidase II